MTEQEIEMSNKYYTSMSKGPVILVIDQATRSIVAEFDSDQPTYAAARDEGLAKAEAFIAQQKEAI